MTKLTLIKDDGSGSRMLDYLWPRFLCIHDTACRLIRGIVKLIQKLCKSVEEKKKRRLQFVKEITQKPRSPDLEDRLEKELQDWCDENYDTCTRCGSFLLVEKVGIEACTDCMDIVDEDRKERVK